MTAVLNDEIIFTAHMFTVRFLSVQHNVCGEIG